MLKCTVVQTLRFTSFSAWCRANRNSGILIFTRTPRVQTCWLCPCLFVCMYSASSVIKICQSQIHQPTQRWARHPVLQPWMLKQLSPANLWLSRTQEKGAGNDHLHLCQPVKSNPHRQNERCQTLTWRAILRTHAKVCQELISPPVLQQHHRVPSFFYSLPLMRGGHGAAPLLIPPK